MKYTDLKSEYETLWEKLRVRPTWNSKVKQLTDKVALPINRGRYEAVQNTVCVPWQVIACIHALEASLSFTSHLHNGDPLTKRTVHVPKGRPVEGRPPFTWVQSATDALNQKMTQTLLQELGDDLRTGSVGGWTIPACLYFMERYNGWGYRTGAGRATVPPQRSPYLWSGTHHYERGKYVADGAFARTAVSGQVGAAALLKSLIESL